jgi:hypothetical protein
MVRLVPRWKVSVALVAIYALILETLLHSLAPPAQAASNPRDSLSAAICQLLDHSSAQDKAPVAPSDHSDNWCCTLCQSRGPHAAAANVPVTAPDYPSSGFCPFVPWAETEPRGATELSPINPRAPPRSS